MTKNSATQNHDIDSTLGANPSHGETEGPDATTQRSAKTPARNAEAPNLDLLFMVDPMRW